MRQTMRVFAVITNTILATLMAFTFYINTQLPDSISVVADEAIHLPYPVQLAETESSAVVVQKSLNPGSSYQMEARLLGMVPIKQLRVEVVERRQVLVSGAPFGIKMFTDGLMVVGMSDVAADGKRINPAREAGVKIGDMIETVDGVRLKSNEQLGALVEQSQGRSIDLCIRRGESRLNILVPPVRSVGDGKYRLGLWVRDSSAGIGTMTYYDPGTGLFTGLGHPVCDVDTGELMPLQSGEIVEAEITGCKQGQPGMPGELKGRFANRSTLGQLCGNTDTGVYGYLRGDIYLGEPVEIALSQEVQTGPAVIWTTVEGKIPQAYHVEIEKIDLHKSGRQNMVVRVVDPALLEKTGGIVQGMSGSPILQNGRLVGSVTHVFVNDPQRGYGVFAENIEQNAQRTVGVRKPAA